VLLSPGVALILYGLAQVSRDGGVRRREVLIPLAAVLPAVMLPGPGTSRPAAPDGRTSS
jgi:hypothetical protein